jgi:hypothetical protein
MTPASWMAARLESRSVTSVLVPAQLRRPSLTAIWPRPTTRQRSGGATATYQDSSTSGAPSESPGRGGGQCPRASDAAAASYAPAGSASSSGGVWSSSRSSSTAPSSRHDAPRSGARSPSRPGSSPAASVAQARASAASSWWVQVVSAPWSVRSSPGAPSTSASRSPLVVILGRTVGSPAGPCECERTARVCYSEP